jgi:5'-deoxynucleotidase YfbR-like HD superfamily hydrolase
MRVKRRRKPKLSQAELSKIAYGWDKFGDMLMMMGEIVKIEKEVSQLDKLMRKLFRAETPNELFSVIENDPVLFERVVSLLTKMEVISQIMGEKDIFEMSADEQIEAGRSLKEISGLLTEIVEGMEQDERLSE